MPSPLNATKFLIILWTCLSHRVPMVGTLTPPPTRNDPPSAKHSNIVSERPLWANGGRCSNSLFLAKMATSLAHFVHEIGFYEQHRHQRKQIPSTHKIVDEQQENTDNQQDRRLTTKHDQRPTQRSSTVNNNNTHNALQDR